jgi:DNA-binding CsgD family transcriptional regulator
MPKGMEKSFDRVLTLFLLLLCTATIADLFFDRPKDWASPHVIIEMVVFLASLSTLIYLEFRIRKAQRVIVHVNRELQERSEEAAEWKQRAGAFLKGLSEEIHAQFDRWKLTPAEQEVALLLLKGFSHQEIAHLSNRSDRTVRQHAGNVYQKSGLGGRAEFSAFFLEDLLAPGSESDLPAPDTPARPGNQTDRP